MFRVLPVAAFLIVCLLSEIKTENVPEPLVQTDLGWIRGSVLKTLRGLDIYSFRGVRYAESPEGDNRFKAPIPISPWGDAVYDATKNGYICPQANNPPELMSEDCLVLNVYSKNLTGNADVMVYIHGGGNIAGSSHSELKSGPEYLLDQDIVLVNLNYRLGALGFLTTKTDEAKGNYGYLDQVLALKWVKNHIAHFGGNPNSVTIFGVSAGGMAVTLHMVSPLSAGLFHKAIAMSGSTTSHFYIDNLRWTQKLAVATQCPMYNAVDILECLRKVPWQTIIKVCSSWDFYGFPLMRWAYEVDGNFLTDNPTDLFARGDFHKVPLMAGSTKDEFTFCVRDQENNTGLLNDISDHFEKYAPELFNLDQDLSKSKDISEKIKKFYLHSDKITSENLLSFGTIFGDAIITHGMHRLVELARRYIDVYYYRFDYVGKYSRKMVDGKPLGAYHADDEFYLLVNKQRNLQIELGSPDALIVDRLTSWWTSFAKTGTPAPISNFDWLPCNATHVRTMYNDKEPRMDAEPFVERFAFWDSLFPVNAIHS